MRYVDRTTTYGYANAPPSAATRDRVARPVRTQHGRRAPAPAPAPRVLAVPSGVPSGSYCVATAEPSHGALPAQYIGVRGYV